MATLTAVESLTILNGIPVIQIATGLYFDVLDSALIFDSAPQTDWIKAWKQFRTEFMGKIICTTTNPEIAETLGFKRQLDDGTNYRLFSDSD